MTTTRPDADSLVLSMTSGVTSSLARLARRGQGPDAAALRKNLQLLINLRWIAVVGQVVTVLVVRELFLIPLPVAGMSLVLSALVLLNLISLVRLMAPVGLSNAELALALTFDALALTAQLYLSGGVTNPFASLYLLQVILGAMLLEAWSIWMIVAVTIACFAGLTFWYRPIAMLSPEHGRFYDLHTPGLLVGYVFNAVLLVIFATRISANLRARDARLADLRQRAAEEDMIVRIGLLASGAAHELGTPLASLDVILGDWRHMPKLAGDPELIKEIEDMQAEVKRCKTIVSGVLQSSGEQRSETAAITTLQAFLDEVVEDWRESRSATALNYERALSEDLQIVSDSTLRQAIGSLFDNAFDASPRGFTFSAMSAEGDLVLTVADRGPGFSPKMLAEFGRPYRSSKGRPGGGLGLFLLVNVVRKLGGEVSAENPPGGGARVTVILPLAALRIEAPHVQ